MNENRQVITLNIYIRVNIYIYFIYTYINTHLIYKYIHKNVVYVYIFIILLLHSVLGEKNLSFILFYGNTGNVENYPA